MKSLTFENKIHLIALPSVILILILFGLSIKTANSPHAPTGAGAVNNQSPTDLACSESKDSSRTQKAIEYVNGGGVLRTYIPQVAQMADNKAGHG